MIMRGLALKESPLSLLADVGRLLSMLEPTCSLILGRASRLALFLRAALFLFLLTTKTDATASTVAMPTIAMDSGRAKAAPAT